MTSGIEPLVVDARLGAIVHDGRQRRVTRKAMEVLLCLAEADGRVVGKEELIGAAWGGLAVSDEVVSTVIYELRKALGDDSRAPRFIETVRKSGYRWVSAPIRREDCRRDPLRRDEARPVSPAGRGRPWSLWASRAALALLALGAAIGPGRRGAEEPPRGADRIHAEACTLYLKGLHLARQGTRNGVERGLGYLRQAVERDPRFGLAQVALADVYAGEGGELLGLAPAEAYGEAQRAAARALDIDPNLGPAHATLAALRFRYAWDWREAEAGFERARELSTCDPPEVDRRYAEYLSAMGRHEEALSALDGIVAAQPLDLGANWSLGRALYLARRYDGALAQLTATLDLDPHHPPTHRLLGEVHARRGDEAQAFAAFLEEARLLGASPSSLVSLEESFARAGLAGVRRWRLAWAPAGDGRADPVERARLLAELGEVRRALEALDRAYEERRSELVWVGSDPAFDPLRGEPRFRGLLTTLGLRATACG